MAGRSHVIARTFDRVCRVLDELGYLAGDTVTADGQRLARLYTELDLLAAECMRRGLWDGLSPAELAACVSALSFESRKADDTRPPRLPEGTRRPKCWPPWSRTWAELDQLEKDNELSFLREPDLGFAWAAYRWARGRQAGKRPRRITRPDPRRLRPLGQAADRPARPDRLAAPTAPARPAAEAPAAAAGPGSVPAPSAEAEAAAGPAPWPAADPVPRTLSLTARAAIDAMRRGVVAYSAVAG